MIQPPLTICGDEPDVRLTKTIIKVIIAIGNLSRKAASDIARHHAIMMDNNSTYIQDQVIIRNNAVFSLGSTYGGISRTYIAQQKGFKLIYSTAVCLLWVQNDTLSEYPELGLQ